MSETSINPEEDDDQVLARLPAVRSDLRGSGHVFGPELFELLDDFHLPITVQDFWDGKFVNILYLNKEFIRIHGSKSREERIAGINAAGANPTETFVRRAKMWKKLVQLELGKHTDPHKLFPDNKPPIPHYTRMLPVNIDAYGRKGCFTMAVHIPENCDGGGASRRAADAFKYCTTCVAMVLESGKTVWENNMMNQFFATGLGSKLDSEDRLRALFGLALPSNSHEAAVESGGDNTQGTEGKMFGAATASTLSDDENGEGSKTGTNAYDAMYSSVFGNGGEVNEVVYFPKSDEYYRCSVTAAIDPLSGNKAAVVCIDDATEWGRLNKMLSESAAKMKDLNERKDMLFANMSHELKTPLNGIIALAGCLADELQGHIKSEQLKSLALIASSGRRLNLLVTNLLDASLLKKKELAIHAEDEIDVYELVEGVVQLSQPLCKSEDVKLRNACPPGRPAFKGDSNRLTQVISNLVSNALKFTFVGHVTVSCEFCMRETMVAIKVRDTGIGIPDDKQALIFEAMRQVEESADRKYGGTGLGLAIARDLCKAMGGDLTVFSKVGVGSTFTCHLPLVTANSLCQDPSVKRRASGPSNQVSGWQPMSRHSRGSPRSSSGCTSPGSNKGGHTGSPLFRYSHSGSSHSIDSGAGDGTTNYVPMSCASDVTGVVEVFSVDDEPTNQAVVEAILRSRGYKVTKAFDGLEALQQLEARKSEGNANIVMPDLILLDVMMPKMNGFETCAKIRQRFPLCAVPIIMVSAKSREENIIQGLSCGSNDYITKPFSKLELLARIDTQLQLRNAWRSELERERSEVLLRQMLPHHIITRLTDPSFAKDKANSSGANVIADEHSHVVVLFSDIVGFTSLTASTPTIDIIHLLNSMFSRFDALSEEHGVYKVETIGDAYMVVAGHLNNDEPIAASVAKILRFSKDMMEAVDGLRVGDGEGGGLKIRVGVHVGPAYSGVVGTKMPRFCFFGDTVNTASRMESTGFPRCVQVSQDVIEILGISSKTKQSSGSLSSDPNYSDEFSFVEYGEREIKGKGFMRTYLLNFGDVEEAIHLRNNAKKDEKKPDDAVAMEAYQRVRFRNLSRSFSMPSVVQPSSAVDIACQIDDTLAQENEIKQLRLSLKDKDKELELVKEKLRAEQKAAKAMGEELRVEREAAAAARAAASATAAATKMDESSPWRSTPVRRTANNENCELLARFADGFDPGVRPREWDDTNVVGWLLTSIPFVGPRYFLTFRDKGVNGAVLLGLSADEDIKELGVADRMHRKRIMIEIEKLRALDSDYDLRSVVSGE